MEPTFTEAKGLARIFRVITLAALFAMVLSIISNISQIIAVSGSARGQGIFNFAMGIVIELGRLGASFWVFSQVAKGLFISEGLVKACRVLSFLEFLRGLQFVQQIMLIPGQWTQWNIYAQIFQGVSVTLVNASLFYCLGNAIHWALMREQAQQEQNLINGLNPPPPPPGQI